MNFLRSFLDRRRAARERAREAERLVDAIFADAELMAQARLAPRHRARLQLLEIACDAEGAIESLLLGIVRHPKAHPLAPRGEEVVEILQYVPRERTLTNVGSRNVTRSRS